MKQPKELDYREIIRHIDYRTSKCDLYDCALTLKNFICDVITRDAEQLKAKKPAVFNKCIVKLKEKVTETRAFMHKHISEIKTLDAQTAYNYKIAMKALNYASDQLDTLKKYAQATEVTAYIDFKYDTNCNLGEYCSETCKVADLGNDSLYF